MKALILKFVMVEVMVYIVLGAAMKVSIGDTQSQPLINPPSAIAAGGFSMYSNR